MREAPHLQMWQNLRNWHWGLPSLGTSEIEALKKGIGCIILPGFLNWEGALQPAFRIL